MKPLLSAAELAVLASATAAAAQDSGTQIGVVTRTMTGIENIVVYTREELDCSFKPTKNGAEHQYKGVIKEVGVTLSIT